MASLSLPGPFFKENVASFLSSKVFFTVTAAATSTSEAAAAVVAAVACFGPVSREKMPD